MLHDAENIITDSLLEPIGSIILRSLIITECEEKQKVQTAKLQADFDHKLARLRGENEKLNAEKNLLREQNEEIQKLKEALKNAADAKNKEMLQHLEEISELNNKHQDQIIAREKKIKATQKTIEDQQNSEDDTYSIEIYVPDENESEEQNRKIDYREHATMKKIKLQEDINRGNESKNLEKTNNKKPDVEPNNTKTLEDSSLRKIDLTSNAESEWGIHLDFVTWTVVSVVRGKQGREKGVRAGWKLELVNGKNVSSKKCDRSILKQGKACTLEFRLPGHLQKKKGNENVIRKEWQITHFKQFDDLLHDREVQNRLEELKESMYPYEVDNIVHLYRKTGMKKMKMRLFEQLDEKRKMDWCLLQDKAFKPIFHDKIMKTFSWFSFGLGKQNQLVTYYNAQFFTEMNPDHDSFEYFISFIQKQKSNSYKIAHKFGHEALEAIIIIDWAHLSYWTYIASGGTLREIFRLLQIYHRHEIARFMIINAGSTAYALFKIMSSTFLTKRFVDKTELVGDVKDPKEFRKISKFVDPEQIPEEFGGSNTQKLEMGSIKPLIDIELFPEIVNTTYLWEHMDAD